MAISYLAPIDLNQNEVRNARIQNLASAPSSPVSGQVYYDTVSNKLYWWNGSSWVDATGGAITFGTPGSSAVGDSAANGSATTVARSDHTHARESFASVTVETSFGVSSANGTATTVARSDHTHGTPVHGNAAHSAVTLNSLAAPTSDLNLGSRKITALATPTADTDAATKGYADSIATGLDPKASVKAATTANISLSGAQTIDGVSVVAGDRVLVKNQTTGSQNGIYDASAGAWSRSADADTSGEVTPGLFTFVEGGTLYGGTGWVLATSGSITLGTTALSFTQFSSQTQLVAGNGLSSSGSTWSVGGTSNRIDVTADNVDIAATYTGQTSITTLGTVATGTWQGSTIGVAYGGTGATSAATARANLGTMSRVATAVGDGSSTNIAVTHSLGTRDVQVAVYQAASPYAEVEVDTEHTDTNTVTLKFATAPASGAYRAVVIG